MSICCPICGLELDDTNSESRNVHVNLCLSKSRTAANDAIKSYGFFTPKHSSPRTKQGDSNIIVPKTISKHSITARPTSKPAQSLSKPKFVVPPYKTLQIGSLYCAVDAFCYGKLPRVFHYFLTHFHSDHYGGLTSKWNAGPIYCTPSTARLVESQLKVSGNILIPRQLNQPFFIEGTEVVFLEANHCPGAVLVLFDRRILHTGDFRASPELISSVQALTSKIDILYLDTTYLDTKTTFPSQNTVLEHCSQYCLEENKKPMAVTFFTEPRPTRILVLVGTYKIGKERLAIAIANILKSRIWASPEKQKILQLLDDPPLLSLLEADDGLKCQVHLAPMGQLTRQHLEQSWKFLGKHYTQLIAFVPTGWTYSDKIGFSLQTLRNSPKKNFIQICRVPYSEHSSYSELFEFCRELGPREIIATVRSKTEHVLKDWVKV